MSRINARDTFPRAIPAKKVWATHVEPQCVSNTYRTIENDQYGQVSSIYLQLGNEVYYLQLFLEIYIFFRMRPTQPFYVNRAPTDLDIESRKVTIIPIYQLIFSYFFFMYLFRQENWPINDKMNVSAGELLGRTHEELVLLLIQLRRRSSQTLQAIENCYNESDAIQVCQPIIKSIL